MATPFDLDADPRKNDSVSASPFAFGDTNAGAEDSGYDFEREKADADALFNLSGAGDRFAQTPPRSPQVKIPASRSTHSDDLPKSPSHHSSNSAVSNAFTTPPTSPVTDPVEVNASSFDDFTCSTTTTTGAFGMSGLTASSIDINMFQDDMMNGQEYSSEDVMNASIAWIDAHF